MQASTSCHPVSAEHQPEIFVSSAPSIEGARLDRIMADLEPLLAHLRGRPLELCSGKVPWLPEVETPCIGHLELGFPLTERKTLTIAIQWGLKSSQSVGTWESPDVVHLLSILSPDVLSADPFESPIVVPSWLTAWSLTCRIVEVLKPSSTHLLEL